MATNGGASTTNQKRRAASFPQGGRLWPNALMAQKEHDLRPIADLPDRHYLLFAGGSEARRGDVVATFHDEEEAREAFRRFQATHPSGRGWGELAVLDGRGRLEPMSWFGRGSTADDDTEDAEVIALASAVRTRDRRRRRQERSASRRQLGADLPPVLRPVTDLP